MLMKEGGDGSYTNGAIELTAGNKIALANVWRWLDDGEANNKDILGVDLSNGVWELKKSYSCWQIFASYKLTNGNMTVILPLAGEKPPYSIVIDNWQTGVPFCFVQSTN